MFIPLGNIYDRLTLSRLNKNGTEIGRQHTKKLSA